MRVFIGAICLFVVSFLLKGTHTLNKVEDITRPKIAFSFESTLIVFEKGSSVIKRSSLERLEKTFAVMDTTPNFFNKFSIVIFPASCSEELQQDSLLGFKRCLVMYDILKNRFNGRLVTLIKPEDTFEKYLEPFPCKESGVTCQLRNIFNEY